MKFSRKLHLFVDKHLILVFAIILSISLLISAVIAKNDYDNEISKASMEISTTNVEDAYYGYLDLTKVDTALLRKVYEERRLNDVKRTASIQFLLKLISTTLMCNFYMLILLGLYIFKEAYFSDDDEIGYNSK